VDNVVQIVPVPSKLEEGFGKVRAKKKPEDFKRIREMVEEEVAEEVLREF